MKLKYNFVTNEVADNIVAVAVGDDMNNFNGFIKMNDVGAAIFNLLKNDISIDEMVEEMKKVYPDEGEPEIRSTVTEFVNNLKDADVIE